MKLMSTAVMWKGGDLPADDLVSRTLWGPISWAPVTSLTELERLVTWNQWAAFQSLDLQPPRLSCFPSFSKKRKTEKKQKLAVEETLLISKIWCHLCWVCIRTSQEGLALPDYLLSIRSRPVPGVWCVLLRCISTFGSGKIPRHGYLWCCWAVLCLSWIKASPGPRRQCECF